MKDNNKMIAAIATKYGDPEVLEVKEIEKPVPKNNEILVQIHAVSIQFADLTFTRGKPFIVRFMGSGLLKPKNTIMGSDIAGKIVAKGDDVKNYKIGDRVFGDISAYGWGGFAQYVSVPEDILSIIPDEISFEVAAAIPQTGTVALQGLRDAGNIQSGHKVLIIGASGGIGSIAIQLAKYFGAEVTGVCSTNNVEMLYSIGADYVIDYMKEDFTIHIGEFDLVFDIIAKKPVPDYVKVLKKEGIYVAGALNLKSFFKGKKIAKKENKTIKALISKTNINDLIFLKELLKDKIIIPKIDRIFSLSQITDALNYYSERHTKGKVVISIEHSTYR